MVRLTIKLTVNLFQIIDTSEMVHVWLFMADVAVYSFSYWCYLWILKRPYDEEKWPCSANFVIRCPDFTLHSRFSGYLSCELRLIYFDEPDLLYIIVIHSRQNVLNVSNAEVCMWRVELQRKRTGSHFGVKGKENPWFILNSCIVISVYLLDITSMKKATEYRDKWKIDILTHNPQQMVKIQVPRHSCFVDQSESIISKGSDEGSCQRGPVTHC